MQYTIVMNTATFGLLGTDFGKAAYELTKQVNEHLAQGWKPLGGVALGKTMSTFEPYLFQALIKE
jgi:hypothetical protein